MLAGPGIPACISNLLPILCRCFSHTLKTLASKKNWVAKWILKSAFLANWFFFIMASSRSCLDILGWPSGCPANPTCLNLNLDKRSVSNICKLELKSPICDFSPPITSIFICFVCLSAFYWVWCRPLASCIVRLVGNNYEIKIYELQFLVRQAGFGSYSELDL